ncbi:MAG TPA: cytochrome c peroxidase [Tepidisphaeraceae bacterium]|jgi:YVTN family beta-propeller protein|nr:cytochrome c peroxidase [Tepidisphaeraceae bacterium]
MMKLPCLFFVVGLFWAPALFAGSSNSLMDISADGTLLACSNRDSGSVTIVDLATNKKLRETQVGHAPEGVSFLGAGHCLAVAVYHDAKVVFLDADSGKTLGQTAVFDEPYGVVGDSGGRRVYVTLSYPGQVVEIDAASHAVRRTFTAGPFARGIAIAGDDSRLYVTEFYTAAVLAIDVATGKTIDRWPGTSSDNLSRQITLHPTRSKAYLSHIRSAVERAQGEGSIFPYVTVLDTKPAGASSDKRRSRFPMDSFIGTYVTANPWEVAISPDGTRFFVVFSGTNDLFACEVVDDDYRELRYRATLQLGANPRAVRVSPDNKTFYVYDALDFNVVAYDTDTLARRATIQVAENPLGAEILLGKKLFYTALQPMVGRRWISCASCHPDGETDGRTWQNPEGLRNTPSLAGMAWTHPLHWSADRDEVQEFEHTIRGPLMQGRGLVRGLINPALGLPNKGLSAGLDALAAYSNTHAVQISPYARGGLSEPAKRGREIFFSKRTMCASCHSGPFLTDSTPRETILRHDVGTGADDPTELKGSAYDTPTLLGIYKTAPYLHHGKAATLEDVLTTANHDDRHGQTSQLSGPQIGDLVAFLKCLPYEDPEPQARALGMKKIER